MLIFTRRLVPPCLFTSTYSQKHPVNIRYTLILLCAPPWHPFCHLFTFMVHKAVSLLLLLPFPPSQSVLCAIIKSLTLLCYLLQWIAGSPHPQCLNLQTSLQVIAHRCLPCHCSFSAFLLDSQANLQRCLAVILLNDSLSVHVLSTSQSSSTWKALVVRSLYFCKWPNHYLIILISINIIWFSRDDILLYLVRG